MSASAFFQQQLPTHIAGDLTRFSTLSGRIAFSCGGTKFTVQLGDLECPVVAGFDRTADVKVWFFGDAFERVLRAERLTGKRDRLVQGDLDVLAAFGRYLQPAANALSVRFG